MAGSSNVLVALGLVFMVVGGVGLIFGQLMLQQQDVSDEGSFVTVDLSSSSSGNADDAPGPSPQQLRTYRFMGLVVGVWGIVVALVGGMVGQIQQYQGRPSERR